MCIRDSSCQPCRRSFATQWSHVTRAAPRAADAAAASAHARTLRSRSQSIARWSRQWNARRGFFKAGERLPLETRRAKAGFLSPSRHNEKRGVQKNGPQNRPPSEQHTRGWSRKVGPFFFPKKFVRILSALRRLDYHCRTYRACPGDIATPLPVTPSLLPSRPLCRPSTVCPSLPLAA